MRRNKSQFMQQRKLLHFSFADFVFYDTELPLWAKDLTLDDIYEVLYKESTRKSLKDIHAYIQMQTERNKTP